MTEIAAVETVKLSKRYGSMWAVQDLNLKIPAGEVFGLLGRNGAGKTTTIKLLLGLTTPTSGEAHVLGLPAGTPRSRVGVGYLPELFRYQPWMRADELAGFHCRLARLPRAEWKEEIETAFVTVGLSSRQRDRVGTFSKGMQQRLGLGLASLGSPKLILLDEPTSALDPIGRHDVREIISTFAKRGATVVLNSHLLSEVERVCDRVAIVERGAVIATGSLGELLQGKPAVRIQMLTPTPEHVAVLLDYGDVATQDNAYTVTGIDADSIPKLVTQLVSAGAQITALEPIHHDLEERFLELVGNERDI